MPNLQLRITTSNQVIETHSLTELLMLSVEPGAIYTVVDATTQEPVNDLVLKKRGDALLIEVDGEPVAQLDQFYASEDHGAVFEVSEAGNVKQITAADPAAEDSDIVWRAETADQDPAAAWIGSGLVLGSAVLAHELLHDGNGSYQPGPGPDPESEVNTVQGQIIAGPVLPGNDLSVSVYQADGNTELGESEVDADGRFSVTVGDYRGVVIARAENTGSNEDHLDEATGVPANLNAELFTVGSITEANSVLTLNLNALTTVAYHKALEAAGGEPLEAADVDAVNAAVAKAFGLSDLHAISVITVNGETSFDSSDGLSEGEAYGVLLAAFSGADLNNGGDSQATIDELVAGIDLSSGVAELSPAAQSALLIGAIVAGQTGDAVADLFGEGTGVSGVTTDNQDSVKDALARLPADDSDTPEEVQAIVDALTVVHEAAGGGTPPTLAELETLGITGVTPENLKAMQEAIADTNDDGTDLDTLADLQAVIDAVDVTPPSILSVGVEEGAWKVGDQVDVTLTAADGETGLTLSKAKFNGQELTDFVDNNDGTYTAVYTVTDGDEDLANGGEVVTELALSDGAGNTSRTITSVTYNGASIDSNAPTIADVQVADGVHGIGDEVEVTITATDNEAGLALSSAVFNGQTLSGITDNGDGTYTGNYTVVEGDANIADGASVVTDLAFTDEAGNTGAATRSVTLSGERIDATAPTITEVTVSATGAQNDTLNEGDVVSVTVTLGEDVTLTGTPDLTLNIGGTEVRAQYASGDGSNELVFEYTIQAGQTDTDGISVVADSLNLNGGTLTDLAGNAAGLSHDAVANDTSYKVDTSAPTITSVSVADGTYKVGDEVEVIITAADNETGLDLSSAQFNGQTLTNITDKGDGTYTGIYTVMEGDSDLADGASVVTDLAFTDPAGNTGEATSSVTLSGETVDATRAQITDVAISGATGAQDDTLNEGDVVSVTVTLDETVTVTGTPELTLNIGGTAVQAAYASGSDSNELVFEYTIQDGQTDLDGISIAADSLLLKDGTVNDAAGNAAVLTHNAKADDASYMVDTTAPTVASVSVADGTYKVGDEVEVTITAADNEAGLTLSSAQFNGRTLTNLSNNDDGTYTGTYTVVEGDSDIPDGASVVTDLAFTDKAGNIGEATSSVTLSGERIDANTPSITDVAISGATGAQNDTLNEGDVVSVTVTLDEDVTVAGTPELTLNIGGTAVQAAYASGSGSNELLFEYTIQAGQTDVDGISIEADSLKLNGGTVNDAAGNAAVLSHAALDDNAEYKVDTTAPSINTIALGADDAQNDTLNEGDSVSVTVTMNEAVTVTGTPVLTLNIGGTKVQAVYASGSGSNELVFQYTIEDGQTDLDGISIDADSLSLNGGTLTDLAGHAAVITHTAVTDNDAYKVDTTAPSISGIALSAIGAENDTLNAGDVVSVTVTLDEAALVSGSPQLTLDIGGTPVQAVYASGSGSRELVFEYIIEAGQSDVDGISVEANSLILNGGSLTDLAGNPATLTHQGVSNEASLKVDTTAPTIADVSVADGSYKVGDEVEVTITAANNEAGLELISAQFNGQTLTKVTDHGDGTYTGIYTVTEGDADVADGGSVVTDLALSDAAGNASTPVTSVMLAGESVDANSPAVDSVSVADGNWAIGDTVAVTITATNNETGLTLSTAQFNGQTLTAISDNGDGTYTGTYTVVEGDFDVADGGNVATELAFTDTAGNTGASHTAVMLSGESLDANRPIVSLPTSMVQLEAIDVSNGWDREPQVTAVGSDGAYVVTWYGSDSEGDISVFLQRFNADGTTDGNDPVQLEAIGDTTSGDYRPQVTALDGGEFVVTWTTHTNDSGGRSVWTGYVQHFNAEGTTTGYAPVELPYSGNYSQVTSVGNDGAYAVTWQGDGIFVQRFNSDGTIAGNDPVQLKGSTITNVRHNDPQIAAVGSIGEYVVTWWGDDENAYADKAVYLQRFNADGTTAGDILKLEAIGNTTGENRDPQVTAVDVDGSFVVTWIGQDSDNVTSVFVQHFNADGTTTGNDPVQLNAFSKPAIMELAPQISALNGGAYVVTWSGRESNGDWSIFVQRFNADGTTTGNDPVELDAIGVAYGEDDLPQVASVGSDGAYVVVWEGMDTSNNRDFSIFVQRFNPDGTIAGNAPVQLEAIGNTDGNDIEAQVSAVGSDGAFVVTWRGVDSEGDDSVFVQRFNADGTPAPKLSFANAADVLEGNSITARTSEPGTAYVVNSSVTVNTVDDITSAANDLWNEAPVAADREVSLSVAGLSEGDYVIYTIDASGNLSAASPVALIVDTTPPTIDSVSVADGSYKVGDEVEVTITAAGNEAGLTLSSAQFNGQTLTNVTDHGDGTYTGTYTVVEGDPDVLDGGMVATELAFTDPAGNIGAPYTSVTLDGENLSANSPSINTIAFAGAIGVQNGTLNAGDVVTLLVTMDESVTVTGTPQLTLNIGDHTAQADFQNKSGSAGLLFQYTVQAGDTDADGMSLDADSLTLNGGTVTDSAGNAAVLSHVALDDNAEYKVDTTAPTASALVTSIEPGADTTVVSSEVGVAYLVNQSVTVNTLADITGAADDQWNSVAITSANTNTDLSSDGLGTGDYKLYTTDAAGNLSAASDETVTIASAGPDTSVVVFDMVNGVSSSHSGRTFDANTSYDIYLRVDSDSGILHSTPQSGAAAGANWDKWLGGDKLGADDRIILVGDGAPVIDESGGSVNGMSATTGRLVFSVDGKGPTAAVEVFGSSNGYMYRSGPGLDDTKWLWDGAWQANPNANNNLSTVYFNNVPTGILTSQGLV